MMPDLDPKNCKDYIGISLTFSSSNNTIWGNYFDYRVDSSESSGNRWYSGNVGNWYGDYISKYPHATHDDRVWNTPYVFGNTGDQDDYPLYSPLQPVYIPNRPIISLDMAYYWINISWRPVWGAVSYKIYRANVNITSIEGLAPLILTANLSYKDENLENGTYYYAVVAVNQYGESLPSHCMSKTISFYDEPPPTQDQSISGYPLLLFCSCIGIIWGIAKKTKSYPV
jgi:hypothetical protein